MKTEDPFYDDDHHHDDNDHDDNDHDDNDHDDDNDDSARRRMRMVYDRRVTNIIRVMIMMRRSRRKRRRMMMMVRDFPRKGFGDPPTSPLKIQQNSSTMNFHCQPLRRVLVVLCLGALTGLG